jgi:asparagine synthase (glutamine-hydrolysing)
VLVLNGEIYNFVELRGDLEREGVRFRGHSDTEVLLAAIERWGFEEALRRAAGMFAIALWDGVESRLMLARDRAGKKPLYFAVAGGGFYFASEIKALRDGARLPLSVDGQAIHHYLSLGYVPSLSTAYREVKEVPAGCWMIVDADLTRRVHRYWSLPQAGEEEITADEAIAETERLLGVAVTQRMRADVPVGVFLSGGIDSGLITAMAAQQSATPIRTFTISFDSRTFDEAPLARLVSERYATEHQTIELSPDLDDLLPRVVRAYDEPFADPSAIPTYAVARAASRELKVVLNGEGADELFAGYRRAIAARYLSDFAALAEHVPGIHALTERLPHPAKFRSPYALAYRGLRGLGLDSMQRFLVWSTDGFSERDKERLYRGGTRPLPTAEALHELLAPLATRSALDHFMAVDFALSLGDCLLVKMDIATMAHSLEARSPFLDHRVIEWAASLPRRILFSGTTTKPLLRKLAQKYLPPEITTAPKRGFEIPLFDWLTGKLAPMLNDLCLSPTGLLADLFDRREIERIVLRKTSLDDQRWAKCTWILLMLALWDKHCNSPGIAADAPVAQPRLASAQ